MTIEKNLNEPVGLDPLLTSAEVQRLLRINVTTLARLCKKRLLPPPVKVGNANRWRVQDIKAVLDGRDCCRDEQKQSEDRLETDAS